AGVEGRQELAELLVERLLELVAVGAFTGQQREEQPAHGYRVYINARRDVVTSARWPRPSTTSATSRGSRAGRSSSTFRCSARRSSAPAAATACAGSTTRCSATP